MTSGAKHYVGAVVGVYDNCEQASKALDTLKHTSIPWDDISLLGSEENARQAQQGSFYPPPEVLHGQAREGAVLGGGMGAVAGLVLGFSTFLIPGLGIFAALGPLAGMLTGAGIGVVTGGPLGEVNYQDEAIAYRRLLGKGNVFVIVHCAAHEEEQQAVAALTPTLPRELHVVPYGS